MTRIARLVEAVALPSMLTLPFAAQAQSARVAEPEGEKAPAVEVTDDPFKCMLDMTHVRGFYVDNLLGKLEGTIAVAADHRNGCAPRCLSGRPRRGRRSATVTGSPADA